MTNRKMAGEHRCSPAFLIASCISVRVNDLLREKHISEIEDDPALRKFLRIKCGKAFVQRLRGSERMTDNKASGCAQKTDGQIRFPVRLCGEGRPFVLFF